MNGLSSLPQLAHQLPFGGKRRALAQKQVYVGGLKTSFHSPCAQRKALFGIELAPARFSPSHWRTVMPKTSAFKARRQSTILRTFASRRPNPAMGTSDMLRSPRLLLIALALLIALPLA